MFKRLLLAISFILIVFLQQTSWFDSSRSWQEASGWSEVKNKKTYTAKPKISWLGHAGFLIQFQNINILLDPNLSDSCTIVHRETKSFVSSQQLPRIDAVLLSHMHYDHFDVPTLLNIAELNKVVLAKGSEIFLPKELSAKAFGLELWQRLELENNLTITAVPAVHNGARNHPFASNYKALGYVISDGQNTIYFAGDTGWGSHFEEIKYRFAPNITIIPIGGYEPYFILKNYHLNPEDAARAIKVLGSKVNIPSHFGTFRVALETQDIALPRFFKSCDRLDLNCELALPYQG